jgi:hypothetical protein
VALGVLTCLVVTLLIAAQQPLVLLAINQGVHYIFVPLLVIALITLCLGEAALAILQWVEQTPRRTLALDAARTYRID